MKTVLRWSGRCWVEQEERSPRGNRGMWRARHASYMPLGNTLLNGDGALAKSISQNLCEVDRVVSVLLDAVR